MSEIKKIKYHYGMWLLSKDKKIVEIVFIRNDRNCCNIDRELFNTISDDFLHSCVPLPFQKGDMVEYDGELASVSDVRFNKTIWYPKGIITYTLLKKGHVYFVNEKLMSKLNNTI